MDVSGSGASMGTNCHCVDQALLALSGGGLPSDDLSEKKSAEE